MYPPPTGPEVSEEQARELDDTFLSSDPFEYFRARIAALFSWLEVGTVGLPAPAAGSALEQFDRYLQRSPLETPVSQVELDAQVAADALALRHHAAETLLRFAHARLTPAVTDSPTCVWARVATSPFGIDQVLEDLHHAAESSHAGEWFMSTVVPPEDRDAVMSSPELVEACNVFGSWLAYAGELLQPSEINIHAAHNKTKHGLAVRARADVRLEFVQTPPDADGNIPLSALRADTTVTVFDKPVLEVLSRPPKVDRKTQGLEVTQLRLNTPAILAEAFMLAHTHAAMFHVAAVEHFSGRNDLEDYLKAPAHPGMPMGGPLPEHIDPDAMRGIRLPITTPPTGGSPRRTIIAYGRIVQEIEIGPRSRGRVVDG